MVCCLTTSSHYSLSYFHLSHWFYWSSIPCYGMIKYTCHTDETKLLCDRLHYLYPCSLIITVAFASTEINPEISHCDVFQNHTIKITATSPRHQWVKGDHELLDPITECKYAHTKLLYGSIVEPCANQLNSTFRVQANQIPHSSSLDCPWIINSWLNKLSWITWWIWSQYGQQNVRYIIFSGLNQG